MEATDLYFRRYLRMSLNDQDFAAQQIRGKMDQIGLAAAITNNLSTAERNHMVRIWRAHHSGHNVYPGMFS